MSVISLNIWCIVAAIILGCFLVEVQPREFTRVEHGRKEHHSPTGDQGPSVIKEVLAEDLYERYLADSRRNEYTVAPSDQMITDVNDNALKIVIDQSSEVWENEALGSFVAAVVVYDTDSGENSRINCEIDDNHFSIVKLAQDLTFTRFKIVNAEVLDHETQAEYTIHVTCQNNGETHQTVTKQVEVIIRDLNDNRPAITINTLFTNGEAKIRENTGPGMFVTYVSVYDRDSGDNGRVECELDNDLFRLITLYDTEYKIITTKVLDHEMQAMYKLIIKCQDSGEYPNTSTKQLMVNIEDVNDNAPAITLPINANGKAKVRENTEPGTFVMHVSVYDADSGDNGRFECELDSNHFRLVKLYDTEFTVVSAETFDREWHEQYSFNVRCQDNGDEPRTTIKWVEVNIEDDNDNTPIFHKRLYTTHITEHNITGMPVFRIYALDEDIGYNGVISYALDQAAEGYFKIDPVSGLISTEAVLDHKETPGLTFNVTASDHGSPPRMAHAQVNVRIIDVNYDNAPVFGEVTYHFTIPENARRGTTVGHVQVTDKDSGPSVQVLYRFGYTPFHQLFHIDADTGEIVLREPVDFEEQRLFVFSVFAEKPHLALAEAKAEVKIMIMDINDNTPVITINTLSTSDEAEVREKAEPGTFVAYISVYDADNGDNGRFSCSLDDDHFKLIELYDIRFKIVTTAMIEHNYTLKIKCEDNAERPLTTTKQLVINRGNQ